MSFKLSTKVAYYPTLLFNVLREKFGVTKWYHAIDDTVILGALPFRNVAKKLITEYNIKGVVSMNELYEMKFFCPTKNEWSNMGVEQINLPTIDYSVPSLTDIRKGVDFINHKRDEKSTVYVHCKAGRTRSATLVAAYLCNRYNYSPEEAVEEIRKKRSHIYVAKRHILALHKFVDSSHN
ncbi:DgyrCDS2433 [Dimorphilus gyrociliatus]|uniref:Phosphatidylglycerophosphatase and protein-tyrosine phosphatase 1 n=1 Tax=Dimorphilus gyrociliatus TaxID=2664684 RepID=A0A7I8VC88_9ANNE|nr:DgyrCDS2433 [Dimorphilus gyrociliatus]